MDPSTTKTHLEEFLETNRTEERKHAGIILANPPEGEEVVITGIAGRFPAADNVYQLRDKLLNKIDMVTNDNDEMQWQAIHSQLPKRSGKINHIKKFDAGFFGVPQKQANAMDPLGRQFLERAYEAVIDAGFDPQQLRGSRTGVFAGVTLRESHQPWFYERTESPRFGATGCFSSIHAQQISYFLGLEGPTVTMDTGCSSSLFALEHAYMAIRNGKCNSALVGGLNLNLNPLTTLECVRFGLLSPDGACKSFDRKANGFARAKAITVVFLQKAKDARRVYAQILHAKSNGDGFTEEAIMYPSWTAQSQLFREVCHDSRVDPATVDFIEGHFPGTKAGDTVEVKAIGSVFLTNRTRPLLIGSVKSNMGHAEAAAGLCSLVKVLLNMENNCLFPDLNYTQHPAEGFDDIKHGRMVVVSETTAWPSDGSGIVCISGFGFGGANCCVLLKRFQKPKLTDDQNKDRPRLVCVSGRTAQAVDSILNDVSKRAHDGEYIKLLGEVFRNNVHGHLHRGYMVVSKGNESHRSSKEFHGTRGHLCLALGGPSPSLLQLAKELSSIPLFESAIKKIDEILPSKGTTVTEIIHMETYPDIKSTVVGTVAIQIAVVEILRVLDLRIDYFIGNSTGELVCAYADGILTMEQAVSCADAYGDLLVDAPKISDEVNGSLEVNGLAHEGFLILNNLKNIIPNSKQDSSGRLRASPKNELTEFFSKQQTCPLGKHVFEIPVPGVILEMGWETKFAHRLETLKLDSSEGINSLLFALGRLYELGYNFNLDKLYPETSWPVSPGTPMLSPLIEWNHSANWSLPIFDSQKLSNYGSRIVAFNAKEPDWNYLLGNNIDGYNLIPAAGYLVMVWETLAIFKRVSISQLPIVFESVIFERTTKVPEDGDIKFTVTINKTGRFVVEESNETVVSGTIDEVHNLVDESAKLPIPLEKHEEMLLTQKDIYKELKLKGYKYTGSFCSLQECDVSASKATISCDSNWTILLDSMIQMELLQNHTRTHCVAIGIERLTIDPRLHIKDDDKLEPLIPVYNYKEAKIIKSKGVEVRGITTKPCLRQKQHADPILETYKFIPLQTELTLEQSLRVHTQILLENIYTTRIRVLEVHDGDHLDDSPMALPLYETMMNQPLIRPEIVLLSDVSYKFENITVKNSRISKETGQYLLVVASDISKKPQMIQQLLRVLETNGMILLRENLKTDVATIAANFNLETLSVHKTEECQLILLRRTMEYKLSTVIKVSSSSFGWLPKLQAAMKNDQKVIIYAQNEPTSGILGFFNSLKQEPGGFNLKCVHIMDPAPTFRPNHIFYTQQLKMGLNVNVLKNGRWGTYRHLSLENVDYVGPEHLLSNQRWVKHLQGKSALKPKNVIDVNYCSLIFKDAMLVTDKHVNVYNVQGLEYSGRDSRGNRVMGMVNAETLTNSVNADSSLMWQIPDDWSLEDGATVPVVYSAVMYIFAVVTKVRYGQSVLIHCGDDGVGEAAINVALHYGCNIFTTVDTEPKRNFIKTHYSQIPEHRIGDSRGTSFKQAIMKQTNGVGVDVILNSTNEELRTFLECLGPNGKFIEIGKSGKLQLRALTNSRSFHNVSLDFALQAPPSIKRTICKLLEDSINKGVIKPLNRTVFDMEKIDQAYQYMNSDHIEKVIIKVRQEAQISKKVPRFYSNSGCTYVIVGGLGGLGLELADWLITRGVRKLVLCSRRGVTDGYQTSRIRFWKSCGIEIKVLASDVTTKQACINILEEANKLGDVEAIFNLALILCDSTFENQNEGSFIASLGPKAVATEHLDSLSREMCRKLKYFVVFSSVTSGRGLSGQTNYGMANSVMERICERRVASGYPGLAVQWGAVAEVGAVAHMEEGAVVNGGLYQSVSSCLQVMDIFLKQKETVVTCMVLAQKLCDVDTADVVNTVKNIMGLKDLRTISFNSTLSELGLDSIKMVEMHQMLTLKLDVSLTTKDIRRMTFKRLQELEEEMNRRFDHDYQHESLYEKPVEGVSFQSNHLTILKDREIVVEKQP